MTVDPREEKLPKLVTSETGYRWAGFLITFFMFVSLIVWSAMAPMKSAIVATGKIVVESRNKVVQHLDGGIVAEILVRDGARVEKGQVLLRLSPVQLTASLDVTLSQWWDTLANLDRLRAERDGLEEIVFSEALMSVATKPVVVDFMASQQQLFSTRRAALQGEQEVLQQRLKQTEAQIVGIERVLANERGRAGSLQQDMRDWDKLYKLQLTDKVRLREMQRQLIEMQSTAQSRESEMARLHSTMIETKRQMQLKKEEYQRDIGAQMQSFQGKKAEIEARKIALEDQLNRIEVRATETGRIVGFDVVTVGAILEPRKAIMQIVPDDHRFAMSLQVKQTDIDKVTIGLPVEIKFSAFNLSFMPVMYGKVTGIGADTVIDEVSRQPVYNVKVIPNDEAVAALEKQGWALVAGMPADAYIQYGERTMLDYLTRPFIRGLSRAFNEDY